ncbi:SRPBCC family protein [Actinomadura madurae]|uniref:SRPBCC family protein n=1 Tax=Actinomadura madurae TaxID=1993 RepID=UPI003999798C
MESITLQAAPDRVWQVVSDVANVASWTPGVKSSWVEGDVRHVELLRGGPNARERILGVDDATRTLTYEYLDGGLPVTHYAAEIVVQQTDHGTTVVWTGQLSAESEQAENKLAPVIAGMYAAALQSLAERVR